MKRRSAPLYGPFGSGRTLRFTFTLLCFKYIINDCFYTPIRISRLLYALLTVGLHAQGSFNVESCVVNLHAHLPNVRQHGGCILAIGTTVLTHYWFLP